MDLGSIHLPAPPEREATVTKKKKKKPLWVENPGLYFI